MSLQVRGVSGLLVALISIGLLTGGMFGVLVPMHPQQPPAVHRPEANAIGVHLLLAATAFVVAVAGTARSRSARWLWWPVSNQAKKRLDLTFRFAGESVLGMLRAAVMAVIILFVLFLAFRMGMQATAWTDPGFSTLNAWGGPTELGAFLAHGLDAVLCMALACVLAHVVLRRPTAPEGTTRSLVI
ncbi:hypothetical protein GCM10009590_18030 [Brachybacterium alimentarium]